MPDPKKPFTTIGRRRILKTIGLGGVLASAKILPEQWTRPVVESVLLPAHAQTSQEEEQEASSQCFAGSADSVDDDTEGVAIIFDGESSCELRLVSGPNGGDSGDADEILLVDNDLFDNGDEEFDLDGPAYGANWSNDGPDLSSQTAGNYQFDRTRTAGPNAGVVFRVSFTVSFTQPDTMTVSNVVITRL